MGYSKTLLSGDAGSLVVSEEAGTVKLALTGQLSLGGGEAAGVVSGKASVEVDLGAKQLIDLGFGLAESKFPAVASLLKAAQDVIDAELSKA